MSKINIYLPITFCVFFIGIITSCKKSDDNSSQTDGLPPETWQEHWFEHSSYLTRTYYNDEIAVYYDEYMPKSVTWPNTVMSDVWAYTKKTYGDFGTDPRLFLIFHLVGSNSTGIEGGGHPASYFDASHDYHNTIDCGLGDWTNPTGEALGIPVHEIGHIVCGASHGVQGSPSDVLWGDSKFMEIFIYDVYANIGKQDAADEIYAQMQNQYDDFPKPHSQWFKNWFYPIYTNYGKGAVLNKYFALLAENFPKKNNGKEFSRNLNWGEFIHFWSGAAGVDLKAQAITAFGWSTEWQAMLDNAREDFPNVKYPHN